MAKKKTFEERFLVKFNKKSSNECWDWKASLSSQGYPMFWHQHSSGKMNRNGTHFSWRFYNKQEVPFGMCVCHKCDNPKCVNPKHLFLGTHKDNIKDMWAKGRSGKQRAGKMWLKPAPIKTHCIKGHPFSGKNLRLKITKRNPQGEKVCRKCTYKNNPKWSRNYYLKNRDKFIEKSRQQRLKKQREKAQGYFDSK